MDYEYWWHFRRAYQFLGADSRAFWAMTKSPYWEDQWTEAELKKWETDLPTGEEGAITGATLLYMAKEDGVTAYNPIDLQQPDMIIEDMRPLSAYLERSYLLIAKMGTGKTINQRDAIAHALGKGKRVIYVVNTRQLSHAVVNNPAFAGLGAVNYLQDEKTDTPKPRSELRQIQFLVVCAQTFGTWVIMGASDLNNVGLIVFDEIQQVTQASTTNFIGIDGRRGNWSDDQQKAFNNAILLTLASGVPVHALDAGINEQTKRQFPNIPVIQCTMNTMKSSPVTFYHSVDKARAVIIAPRNGLTVVSSDTKKRAKVGTRAIETYILKNCPNARVLRIR